MRKFRNVPPFIFHKRTRQQFADYLNLKYPIGLSQHEDLIDRIYCKYPFVDKSTIAVIVRGVFVGIRDLLVLGKVLGFNKLFFNAFLKVFNKPKLGKNKMIVKIKLPTPPEMR